MRNFRRSLLLRLGVLALFLFGSLPMGTAVAAQDSGTSHTNETLNVTVSWTEDWLVDIPPGTDGTILQLDRDNAVFVIIAFVESSEMLPEEGVWLLYVEDQELITDHSMDDPPSISQVVSGTGMINYTESYLANNGDTTVVVVVQTVPVLQSTAVDLVQAEVTLNGEPLLKGSILGDQNVPEDLTGVATTEPEATVEAARTSRTSRGTSGTPETTEEATEETTRTSRTSRGTSETPEATEEATEESTRTSRSSRGTSETPEATEESTRTTRTTRGTTVTPEATEESTGVATGEETSRSQQQDEYTGPVYGYTISWNTNTWQLVDDIESANVDGVRLDIDTGTVFFIGTDQYGADPVGCLLGENEYYASGAGSDIIDNWEVATGSDGEPLWYESDELAWGVFRYTFISSSGQEVEFVDYISCETIPGQDAVLIVQLTSLPENYNDNLDAVLDILENIQFQP